VSPRGSAGASQSAGRAPCYSAAVPDPASRARTLRWLRSVLGIVVFAGVAFALVRILKHWDANAVEIHWAPFWISVAVLLLSNFLQALGWKFLLERMAAKIVPLRPCLRVYMAGQLARYTPGKVALPMVRVAGAPKVGLSPRLMAASVGIEVGTWLGVGTFVGFAALLYNVERLPAIPGLTRDVLWLGMVLVTMGIVAALGVERNRFPTWLLRFMRAEGRGPFVSLRVLVVQVLSWIGWWLLGILAPVAAGSSVADALPMSPIFIVAPILGFLALVAPGGLGVREAIISYALSPYVGPSVAIAAAALARGAAIVSEITGWAIAVLLDRTAKQPEAAQHRG